MVQCSGSDGHALSAQVGNDFLDAILFDRAQAFGREPQTNETTLAFEPETLLVQVRQETATTPVVGVRNAVSGHRFLAGDLTDSGHGNSSGGLPLCPNQI